MDMIVNPQLAVEVGRLPQGSPVLRTSAPVRGKALRRLDVSEERYPDVFRDLTRWLVTVTPGDAAMPPVRVANLARRFGLVIAPSEASKPVHFSCPWREVSPCKASGISVASVGGVLSDWIAIGAENLPSSLPIVPAGILPSGSKTLWIRQLAVNAWLPFEIEAALARDLESLRHLSWDALPANLRDGLETARRVFAPAEAQRDELWSEQAGWLRGPWLNALQEYCRGLVREGWLAFNDGQSSRFYAYDPPFFSWLQRCTTRLVEAPAGCGLRPVCCYLGSYVAGASLEIHTDRPECEYSLSLLLDSGPEDPARQPWPLCIRDPASGRNRAFAQQPGDALFYRGTRLPHFRDPLTHGWSTSVFFHFVNETIQGPLR